MLEVEIIQSTEFKKNIKSRFWSECNGLTDVEKKYTRIKCPTCNEYTSYGSKVSCEKKNNDIIFYECFKCCGYYGVCFTCNDVNNDKVELAQLIEHHNFNTIKKDEDDFKVVLELNEYSGTLEDCEDDDQVDELYIHYSSICYTKPIYFYDENKFSEFTGPDGGYTSEWKCNCSTRTILDK